MAEPVTPRRRDDARLRQEHARFAARLVVRPTRARAYRSD